jgi:Ca2+-binding RTX toxin-like protein
MTLNINFLGIENQPLEIKNSASLVKKIWESRLDSKSNVNLNIEVKFSDFTNDSNVLGREDGGLDPELLRLQNKGVQNLTLKEKKDFNSRKLAAQKTLGLTSTRSDLYIEKTYDEFIDKISLSNLSDNDKVALDSLKSLAIDVKFSKPKIKLSRPNAKALGFVNDNAIDAKIFINTNLASFQENGKSKKFSWSYNSSNDLDSPVDQSKKDFIGLLSHEVGHALGFASDNYDGNSSISSLDLFRFSGKSKLPATTVGDFQKYFSIDRGTTRESYFEFADDQHFSQYTDGSSSANGQFKKVTGLMSPFVLPRKDAKSSFNVDELQPAVINQPSGKVQPGSFDRVKKADLIALDVIGWDLKQINTGKLNSIAAGKNRKPRSSGKSEDKILAKNYQGTEQDDTIALSLTNGTAINGNGGYDIITGSDIRDTIEGGTENDELFGGAGDDVIFGREDDDNIDGGIGNDALYGGIGDDFISGGEGNEIEIQGNEGNDFLLGDNGNDKILGGADNDYIFGGAGNDNLDGGVGDDSLLGEEGDDILNGSEGNDYLNGGLGGDALTGGNGDDIYAIDNVFDVITGETASSGIDAVVSDISFNLVSNIEDLTLTGFGNTTGAGNDLPNTLIGNNQKNILNGLGGDDVIYGNGGDDTLKGGVGNDYLDGGFSSGNVITDGSISSIESGANQLEGGVGNDTYIVRENDTVLENANEGTDTVIANASYILPKNVENLSLIDEGIITDVITPSIAGLLAGRDSSTGLPSEVSTVPDTSDSLLTVSTVEANSIDATGNDLSNQIIGNGSQNTLLGLGGNDTLDGSDGNDVIYGSEGEDNLSGSAGNDQVFGGNDRDSLTGSDGDDILDGENDWDTLQGGVGADSLYGGNSDDVVFGGADQDYLNGGNDNDILDGEDGFDLILGEQGADSLYGANGDDTIFGGMDNDYLNGGNGDDKLDGGDDNDYLIGGGGFDTLTGGRGFDTLVSDGNSILTGGEDRDLFALSGLAAVITDFDVQQDQLNLTSLGIKNYNQINISQSAGDTIINFNDQLITTLQGVDSQIFKNNAEAMIW